MDTNKIKVIQNIDGYGKRQMEGEFQMDILKGMVGDGNAKITLGSTQSDKDFGNGVETFISVTLTCNQDVATIEKALDIVKTFLNERLPTIHSEGLAIWAQQKALNNHVMKA